ncbi:hypothetical protein Dda_6386 [Drechslerella dactyloides]|uniref:Uncharacterized protein n=1 Tax=Drechslerella dactyloides TaxID=74499 RepID=A0AAD6IX56_DREDA|nr:hypothetical protein Dda_6386 [Drechslerella dactyloides]
MVRHYKPVSVATAALCALLVQAAPAPGDLGINLVKRIGADPDPSSGFVKVAGVNGARTIPGDANFNQCYDITGQSTANAQCQALCDAEGPGVCNAYNTYKSDPVVGSTNPVGIRCCTFKVNTYTAASAQDPGPTWDISGSEVFVRQATVSAPRDYAVQGGIIVSKSPGGTYRDYVVASYTRQQAYAACLAWCIETTNKYRPATPGPSFQACAAADFFERQTLTDVVVAYRCVRYGEVTPGADKNTGQDPFRNKNGVWIQPFYTPPLTPDPVYGPGFYKDT